MYVRYSACYLSRRSLFDSLIGVLGDMDVSQIEYACIMYVCMYCVLMYVRHSARYAAHRSLFGALIGALGGIDVSQVD